MCVCVLAQVLWSLISFCHRFFIQSTTCCCLVSSISLVYLTLRLVVFFFVAAYDKSPAATLMLITLINQYKTCYRLWNTQWHPSSIYALFAHHITIGYHFVRFTVDCIPFSNGFVAKYTFIQPNQTLSFSRSRLLVCTSQNHQRNTTTHTHTHTHTSMVGLILRLNFRSTIRKPYHFYRLDSIQKRTRKKRKKTRKCFHFDSFKCVLQCQLFQWKQYLMINSA